MSNPTIEQWVEVLRELRTLSTRDPRTKPELGAWVTEAISLMRRLRSLPEVSNRVDAIAWHYLSDADIRVKSPEYAEVQRAEFEQWLHQAEKSLGASRP